VKISKKQCSGFFIAVFGIDGEPEGFDYWDLSSLSEKWLTLCKEFLEHHGSAFDEAWSGPLSHIATRFTAGSGAALATFRVSGRLVALLALASGHSPQAEHEVVSMFVESLRGLDLIRAATSSPKPFQGMLDIKERPLMIVVPWPDESITDQDHNLVRELGLHTAGAFFAREVVTSERR
jgi:hypothetical protein